MAAVGACAIAESEESIRNSALVKFAPPVPVLQMKAAGIVKRREVMKRRFRISHGRLS